MLDTFDEIRIATGYRAGGEMLDTFSEKYDIEINSASPDGSSQDELNAVTSQRGQDRAPDVLDLGSVLPEGKARSPEALGDLVKSEVARWNPILKPYAQQ